MILERLHVCALNALFTGPYLPDVTDLTFSVLLCYSKLLKDNRKVGKEMKYLSYVPGRAFNTVLSEMLQTFETKFPTFLEM